jgi:hypothetical protein
MENVECRIGVGEKEIMDGLKSVLLENLSK